MDTVEVASIRSAHGNSHLFSDMIKSASRGREFYVNERTGAWLENQQHSDRSPSVVLCRHLLDFYYTHLGSGDGFYRNRLITYLRAHIVMNSVEVAKIANVHGKRDLDVIIKPALQAGKTFYTNEGTGEWLSAQGNRFSMEDPSISEGVRQRLLQIYITQSSSRSHASAKMPSASVGAHVRRSDVTVAQREVIDLANEKLDVSSCSISRASARERGRGER